MAPSGRYNAGAAIKEQRENSRLKKKIKKGIIFSENSKLMRSFKFEQREIV